MKVKRSLDSASGLYNYEIKVIDRGIGITDEDLKNLFIKPYFKSSDKTSRDLNQLGNGLGLHISFQIAKILGGSLSVESTYGQGSVFMLTFSAKKIKHKARRLS